MESYTVKLKGLYQLLKIRKDDILMVSVALKNVRQGKFIAVHIETSSLWAEFVNKNRCISVRLVSEEVKSIKF